MKAARALAAGEALDDAVTLSAVAHAFVGSKAAAAVDECMQLSGGIGFTWEYPLHHELRRVFTNGYLLGTARASRALLAERSQW
jgi:alkylation response protein AidB-like acyl-CoA dehydrogenase